MSERFWVIGGEFRDADFQDMIDGTERLVGPFVDRACAVSAWRDLATETRNICLARYTVVREAAMVRGDRP